MLLLTRHENEAILLKTDHGEVRITVSEIKGSQVRIGIEAPKDIVIAREEVTDSYKKPVDPGIVHNDMIKAGFY